VNALWSFLNLIIINEDLVWELEQVVLIAASYRQFEVFIPREKLIVVMKL